MVSSRMKGNAADDRSVLCVPGVTVGQSRAGAVQTFDAHSPYRQSLLVEHRDPTRPGDSDNGKHLVLESPAAPERSR